MTFDPRVGTEGEGGWGTPSPLIHYQALPSECAHSPQCFAT